jgi:hypothetical protein
MQRANRFVTSTSLCLVLGSAALPLCASAANVPDSAAVQSAWRPQQIQYSYTAFTTAYDCDAAAAKLKEILTTLGAHPQTKVRASGCYLNRPSRQFFVTITTATPVAVSGDQSTSTQAGRSEQALLDKLGGKNAVTTEPFAATWQTVDLSRVRKLDLQPGDCELMEGLRDHVLPKIGVRVVNDKVLCFPNTLSFQAPQLEVSALVPVNPPSIDDAGSKQRAVG